MKVSYCFFLVFLPFFGMGQTVNDIPIEDIDVKYIQIVGTGRALSDKVNVKIDFGQDTKFFGSSKSLKILDKEGKKIKFNSMIDALNFMSKNGYEFVQAYAVNEEYQEIHYLMRKKESSVVEEQENKTK